MRSLPLLALTLCLASGSAFAELRPLTRPEPGALKTDTQAALLPRPHHRAATEPAAPMQLTASVAEIPPAETDPAAVARLAATSFDPAEITPRPRTRPGHIAADAAFALASPLAPRTTTRPHRSPNAAPVAEESSAAALPALARAAIPLQLELKSAAPAPFDSLTLTETLAALADRAARLMPPPDELLALATAPERPQGGTITILSTSNAIPAPMTTLLASARIAAFVSPRPRLRPEAEPAVFIMPLRPLARPALAPAPDAAPTPEPAVAIIVPPGLTSLRPAPRPSGLRRAAPVPPTPQITLAAAPRIDPGAALVKPRKGALCGNPAIKGERLAPIPARIKGCGIAEPVRVTEVNGVRLNPAATIDCDAAQALSTWIVRGLEPAMGDVRELRVAASYACRPRNNIKGARISEHGRGNAIDIAAVTLASGQTVEVLGGYKRSPGLRQAHHAACGIFGTTLGPGSDGYHENHLHFDVARYRSGAYCR